MEKQSFLRHSLWVLVHCAPWKRKSWRKSRAFKQALRPLYQQACRASRNKVLFDCEGMGISDTLEGRLESLMVHVFFLCHRLRVMENGGHYVRIMGKIFADDIEWAFRESGTGDMRIPSKVKLAVRSLYGRMEAYEAGLTEEDTLREALIRNVYPDDSKENKALLRLASYIRSSCQRMDCVSDQDIFEGKQLFMSP